MLENKESKSAGLFKINFLSPVIFHTIKVFCNIIVLQRDCSSASLSASTIVKKALLALKFKKTV